MTYFEKIKEYVEKDESDALGRFICNIFDLKVGDCDLCPATDFCSRNHNGWEALMRKEFKE